LDTTEQDGAVAVWRYGDTRRQRDEGQRVFTYNDEPRSIVKTFWRALRRLESDTDFVSQWRYSFPHRDVERLGKLLGSGLQ
jgi:hypothetical protein